MQNSPRPAPAYGHNRSLGEQVHEALVEAARARSEAERAEKLCKRIFSQLVVSGTGSVAAKEHAARTHARYIAVEDDYLDKATQANVAKAEADGLQIQFSEWQTRQATAREEMKIR